ncbi:PTS transporter subunit EIIB [Paenibacillus larvae]|uniref:PTS transporter subunit EIIB n=1 Tax=Paenibacillus larvae TaxID=1464 RepID=UPI000CF3849F|nr:PTS transporter subunit EIIB [Paenibacillus larvae]MCY7520396.1 PTS transporter subunit EIIB [Paenibacillus larvae]MCY9501475.1 PTS transporter subunit EIIB [Paenibacillus larvae]MCY9511099.1 PTS transporter subunit EIIB [Paenibacillus larvae]MCY9524862.1 PTS transporter subunit EIIB [Paenibacillus larvae]MCY9680002.1 PTS transporter subunit EIIB [Paenibacillus larvae]
MDYNKVGIQVLELVGGKENINKLTHCAIRLRFEFHDAKSRKKKKSKNCRELSVLLINYPNPIIQS